MGLYIPTKEEWDDILERLEDLESNEKIESFEEENDNGQGFPE